MDVRPRTLDARRIVALENLARRVVSELEKERLSVLGAGELVRERLRVDMD